MLLTRLERAERLRAQVQTNEAAATGDLADVAAGDAAAVQTAWSGFVPMLAHPVMVASASTAMGALDAAAAMLATRSYAAA